MKANIRIRNMGRMGGQALGPGGNCICPSCGYRTRHSTGDPCYEEKCPNCGQKLMRE